MGCENVVYMNETIGLIMNLGSIVVFWVAMVRDSRAAYGGRGK